MEMKRQGSDGIYEICIIESFPGAHKTPLGKNFKTLWNWQPQNALQWPSTKFQHCKHIKYSWKIKLNFRCGLIHKHCVSSGCFWNFCPFVWSHLDVVCLIVLLFVCSFVCSHLGAVTEPSHCGLHLRLLTENTTMSFPENWSHQQWCMYQNMHLISIAFSWKLIALEIA